MNTRPSPYPIPRRRFIGAIAGTSALAFLPRPGSAAEPAGAPRKLGVVLLGLGSYSAEHLGPALRVTRRCRLAGVVTGDRDKGLGWSRDYGFPERNVFTYETMA